MADAMGDGGAEFHYAGGDSGSDGDSEEGPFPLAIVDTEDMGRGAVATRPVGVGGLILRSTPAAAVTTESSRATASLCAACLRRPPCAPLPRADFPPKDGGGDGDAGGDASVGAPAADGGAAAAGGAGGAASAAAASAPQEPVDRTAAADGSPSPHPLAADARRLRDGAASGGGSLRKIDCGCWMCASCGDLFCARCCDAEGTLSARAAALHEDECAALGQYYFENPEYDPEVDAAPLRLALRLACLRARSAGVVDAGSGDELDDMMDDGAAPAPPEEEEKEETKSTGGSDGSRRRRRSSRSPVVPGPLPMLECVEDDDTDVVVDDYGAFEVLEDHADDLPDDVLDSLLAMSAQLKRLTPSWARASASELLIILCRCLCNSFRLQVYNRAGGNELGDVLGVYPSCAMLNHSCSPTCGYYVDDDGCMRIVALEEVGFGDALTVAYVEPSMPRDERREQLRTTFFFECGCDTCASGQ